MMRFTSKISNLLIALLLFSGVVLVACDKTVVNVPDKSAVTFAVDWVGVKSADEANSATIYLYPTTGTDPIVLTGVSTEKTTVDVPAGTYRVVAYNENLSNIHLRNSGSYVAFEAYLTQSQRQNLSQFNSRSSSIETVIPSVEYLHLLTGTANRELVVEGGEPYSFTLHPKTATSTYRFKISMPTRLDFVQVNSVLSGVASRMGLFEAKPMSTDISSVDVPLVAAINATKDTLIARGSVETFGVDPANRNAWSNTLYVNLVPRIENPSLKTNYEIDLTKYFDKYNNLNLDIDVKVEAPDPPNPDEVVFVITVKPWIVEDGGHVDADPDEIVRK